MSEASGKINGGSWSRLSFACERVLAVALSLLLLRSAFAHLGNPYHYLSTVFSYDLTGLELGKGIAITLPSLQLVLGVCLLLRWWPQQAYALASLLFAIFLTAQALVIRQGLQISCGCFGTTESLSVGPASMMIAGSAGLAALVGWRLAAGDNARRCAPVEGGTQ